MNISNSVYLLIYILIRVMGHSSSLISRLLNQHAHRPMGMRCWSYALGSAVASSIWAWTSNATQHAWGQGVLISTTQATHTGVLGSHTRVIRKWISGPKPERRLPRHRRHKGNRSFVNSAGTAHLNRSQTSKP